MKVKLQYKEIIDSIEKSGFSLIKQFFNNSDIEAFEKNVLDIYTMQAKKIGEYRDKAIDIEKSKLSNFEKFSAIQELLEENEKEALYQVDYFLSSSPNVRSVFNTKFRELVTSILGCRENHLLIEGPAIFVNRPNTKRLLYKWHSEAHYYPKRRKFLNIWFPLFDDKNKSNGTMSFKVKSHLQDFPFADYIGYDKDTLNEKNHYTQFEIPENFLTHFEEYFCITKPKDLIISHRRMVHRSNINKTKKYSFAVVARVWDPSHDLTLSGPFTAWPYGGNNIGHPNLIVEP